MLSKEVAYRWQKGKIIRQKTPKGTNFRGEAFITGGEVKCRAAIQLKTFLILPKRTTMGCIGETGTMLKGNGIF